MMIHRKKTNRIIFHSSNEDENTLKIIYHKIILKESGIITGIGIKNMFGGMYEDSINVCFKCNFNRNKLNGHQIESAGCLYHQLSKEYSKPLEIGFYNIGRFFDKKLFIGEMTDYNPFYFVK